MGTFFAIIGAIAYYLFYPLLILIIMIGPIMEFSILLDIYQLNAPRTGMPLAMLIFIGFLLFLSFKVPRLGWLYGKLPVFMPFLQMCFITLIGIELGIFFANLWADQSVINKGMAIVLSVISFVVVRMYLSYWYYKYPISYKVHKL